MKIIVSIAVLVASSIITGAALGLVAGSFWYVFQWVTQ